MLHPECTVQRHGTTDTLHLLTSKRQVSTHAAGAQRHTGRQRSWDTALRPDTFQGHLCRCCGSASS
jgi:hypothetical protein